MRFWDNGQCRSAGSDDAGKECSPIWNSPCTGSNGDREADVDGVRQPPLLRGGSVVVLQQATESLAGENAIVADGVDRRGRHDQPIAQPLMVTFAMIVLDKLADGSPERVFTDENHPVQA